MTEFTARVGKGGLITIPSKEREMQNLQDGDLVKFEVVKHKKQDGEVVYDKHNHE